VASGLTLRITSRLSSGVAIGLPHGPKPKGGLLMLLIAPQGIALMLGMMLVREGVQSVARGRGGVFCRSLRQT